MGLFRRSQPAAGVVDLVPAADLLARFVPLDVALLASGTARWDWAPDADAYLTAFDRATRLDGTSADAAQLRDRLDRWGKDARREGALLLVARRVPLDATSHAVLSLEYMPLLRAALKAKAGELRVSDWLDRAGSLRPADLTRAAEKWGLACRVEAGALASRPAPREATGTPAGVATAGHASQAEVAAALIAGASGASHAAAAHAARSVLPMTDEHEGRAVRIPRLGGFDGATAPAPPSPVPAASSARGPALPKGAVRTLVALVTDFRALEQQYGPRALRRLTDLIRTYEERVRGLYGDARVHLVDLGARPDLQKRPDRIKAHLDAMLERDRAAAVLPDVVQLIGGHAIIPHWALRNPTHDLGDPDEFLLTDNPYGEEGGRTAFADVLLPSRIVARFPGEAVGDSQVLEAQLQAAIEAKDDPAPPARARRHRGVVAAAFSRGDRVFEALAGKLDGLHVAPPFDASIWEEGELPAAEYLYFLVHGSDVWPEWHGDDGRGGFPVVLEPAMLRDVKLPARPTVLTEACFGAYAPGKSADDAMCLALLRAGASRLAGPLNTAWTHVSEELMRHLIAALGERPNLAEALHQARIAWARDVRLHSPLHQKTFVNFVVYGDATPVLRRWAGQRRGADDGALLDELERQRAIVRSGRTMMMPENARLLRDAERTVMARRAAEALDRAGWGEAGDPQPKLAGVAARSSDDAEALAYYRAVRPGPHTGTERVALVCLDRRGEACTIYETTGFARRRPRAVRG